MRPDFQACGNAFLNRSGSEYSQYVYNGSVRGIFQSARPPLITLEGCKELCGAGIQYYPWKDSSNTITTWVLPIVGLLVQAPFESNQAWQTVLLLARWIGSPMATLSYILWNIKVTGKCALMIDMATKYDEYPDEDSEFSIMRDSMYILAIMNQYSADPKMPPVEAERLLRLALFSNLLALPDCGGDNNSLLRRRTDLARNLREDRKKGVVPVFVSFLWFVFSLGLSIDLAFTDIGSNETAHNLAIGFLMGWLPILVLASTVDRNLVSADAIRTKLNHLVDDVRRALLDPQILAMYMKETQTTPEDFAWIFCLGNEDLFPGEFFTGFGGQGRSHWHYGVAHPLLAGIESKFMAEYGRNWLSKGYAARNAIVVGSRNVNGLKMFDPRMAWQITGSLLIVGGSMCGAFILSCKCCSRHLYPSLTSKRMAGFTPTVGLGCRSGGYLVYFIIALGLLVIELLVWWLTHETTHTPDDIVARLGSTLERRVTETNGIKKRTRLRRYLHKTLPWFRRLAFRDVMENVIIRPLEAANTVWLSYTVFAQTLGAYQTCDCMASNWAGHGVRIIYSRSQKSSLIFSRVTLTSRSMLEFFFRSRLVSSLIGHSFDFYTAHGVYLYWGSATALSLVVMSLGLVYIAIEYCTQSHLSTEHYGRAMAGLKHTRWFKKHTLFVRIIPDFVIKSGKILWYKIRKGRARQGRRSLIWTATCKKNPPVIDTNKQPALRMQGTEEQWRSIFGGGRRSTTGLSRSRTLTFGGNSQPPRARLSESVDLEKAETEKI